MAKDLKGRKPGRDVGRGLVFSRLGPVAGEIEDQAQEIGEDQYIDGEQADANPCDAAEDFEYLPGKK
jgi:hypothetical protein